MLYAIVVREEGYPCGNTCGIYDNKELAAEKVKELEKKNGCKDDCKDDCKDKACISFEIIEIEVNKFYRASFNGCGDCLTDVIVE